VQISRRDVLIHVGLFVAACITTSITGGLVGGATLMAILTCHEFGHYFVARRHGVEVSLPYFIPLPPFVGFGTLGAVIRMDKPISDRRALFDVGAAGPIAGLVVAIPLLVIGLWLSPVGPSPADGSIEGNSILYALLKYAVHGQWLPNSNVDVQLHPMAMAAWVGLLITMINLMPIGQLDGGHIAPRSARATRSGRRGCTPRCRSSACSSGAVCSSPRSTTTTATSPRSITRRPASSRGWCGR